MPILYESPIWIICRRCFAATCPQSPERAHRRRRARQFRHEGACGLREGVQLVSNATAVFLQYSVAGWRAAGVGALSAGPLLPGRGRRPQRCLQCGNDGAQMLGCPGPVLLSGCMTPSFREMPSLVTKFRDIETRRELFRIKSPGQKLSRFLDCHPREAFSGVSPANDFSTEHEMSLYLKKLSF